MKLLLLFLVLIQLQSCNHYSTEFFEAKAKIGTLKFFDTGKDGLEVLRLLDNVPTTELLNLMLKGNPLEKIYAFWTYVKKPDSDYRKYFHILVRDTSKVENEQSGCIVFPPTEVGNIVFNIAENRNELLGNYKTYPEYLDSISLEIVEQFEMRGNVNCRIMNLNAPEDLYKKVREKAINGNIPALLGLSGYKKEQDISIIKKYLKPNSRLLFYGLACVEKFPHVNFEEDVLAIYYSKMNQRHPLSFNIVCKLLRNYKTIKTEKAFSELVSNPNKYYYQIIILWHSLEKNDYDHNLKKRIIDKLGKNELDRRLNEYSKMNYWKIAREENGY